MTPKRFFIVFLAACMTFAVPIAAVNVAVDPYLLYDSPRRAGFNANKPAVKTRERLIKAYAAPRSAPRTIILGSSRCDIGMNPDSAVWRDGDRPVYNLSLPGAELDELRRLFQHVVATNSPAKVPQTAIVCLDFEFFLLPQEAHSNIKVASRPDRDEFEARLAVLEDGLPNPQQRWRMALDFANAGFSLNALSDSAITVTANMLPGAWNITANGHMVESIFDQPIAADGVADLFIAKDIDTIRKYSMPHVLSAVPGGAIERFVEVHEIIEIAKEHGISIIFAIQPSHVDIYELFDQLGYWNEFERWKRALAELVAAEKLQGANVRLWDFGGYEVFSQERVPARKERTSRLRWFWDPVHYTTALGDIMAMRMLYWEAHVSYGVELTPEVIDERLAAVRSDRQSYRAREPGEAARRAALLSGLAADVGKTTAQMWHQDSVILQVARLWKYGMQ